METIVEQVAIETLKVRDPFKSLFPVDEERIAKLRDEMNVIGFDRNWPITVWKGKNIIIDGHHRLEAARQSDNTNGMVWVCYQVLPDEYQAVNYALRAQGYRRNKTDWDIFHAVRAIDNRQSYGGKRENAGRNNSNKSSAHSVHLINDSTRERDRIAELLCTNRNKIQRCFSMISNKITDEEILTIQLQSINAAYRLFKDRQQKEFEHYIKDQEGPTEVQQQLLFDFRNGQYIWRVNGREVPGVVINDEAFTDDEHREAFRNDLSKLLKKHLAGKVEVLS